MRHLSYEKFQGWKISNSWGGKNSSLPASTLGNAREGNVAELTDEGNIPLCPHAD